MTTTFAQQFFEFVKSIQPGSRLRLAPTPSGFLHIGNALNFTLNWLAARAKRAGSLPSTEATRSFPKLYLRIDDLDADRKKPEYVQDIFDTLEWLKLDWDGSPVFQSAESQKLAYVNLLHRLRERDLLFACQKSRRDLEPFGGNYPVEFRAQNLHLDTPDVAWRIKTPPHFPLPDFVVRRRDGIPAYQVASLANDLQFGITHIVRGADLEASTAAQYHLAEVLSEDSFLNVRFLHHPLLLNKDGEKLSKSAGADSLKALRDAGIGPEKVFRAVGQWLDLKGDSAQGLLGSLNHALS